MRRLASAIATFVLLSGCAIVETRPLNAGSANIAGVGQFYMLPKALLPIKVTDTAGQFNVEILEPVFVGDPAYKFRLEYTASAMADDTVKITVDGKTSLLKSLTLDSKDQTGEILKKLAALSALKPESAEVSTTTVFQGFIDPERKDVNIRIEERVRKALRAYLKRQLKSCDTEKNEALCKTYADANALADDNELFQIVSTALPGQTGNAYREAGPVMGDLRTDCSQGICHRGKIPYLITLVVAGQEASVVLNLPNNGPILSLPLERKAFVSVKHDVTIQDGMVTDYSVTKPSSALAIVSAPLDIYKAIVDATKEIIQLKIDTSKSNIDLENQRLTEATTMADIKKKLDALNAAKTESAAIGTSAKQGTLLSLGIGKENLMPDDSKNPKEIIDPMNPTQPATPGAPVPTTNGHPGSNGNG